MASSTFMVSRILTRSCKELQHLRESGFHYRGAVLQKDLEYPDLGSRIGYIVEQGFNNNQSEMARALGTGPGTIGNWLNRNQGMDASYAFILQDKYRWNARWVVEGVLPRRIEVTDEEAEALFQRILSLPAERRKALTVILTTD
jgi:hypothetical protein